MLLKKHHPKKNGWETSQKDVNMEQKEVEKDKPIIVALIELLNSQ